LVTFYGFAAIADIPWFSLSLLTAFSAMVDGKSQELSTKELSGGARIQYIFQSIFVKSLEVHD
jgi:hypothetical protein